MGAMNGSGPTPGAGAVARNVHGPVSKTSVELRVSGRKSRRLKIEIRVKGETRVVEIAERFSRRLDDTVLDVRLDGKKIATYAPRDYALWFLDEDCLDIHNEEDAHAVACGVIADMLESMELYNGDETPLKELLVTLEQMEVVREW
jgi:hypothetical protein